MNNNKIKVSVILPNFNHANFLEQRLKSVLNQIYQDLEIILLDDASTDESIEILRKYSNHPKVSHLILNKKNSGSSFNQWQKGLKLAKGDFIWIAESDDYCEPTFLSEIIPLFNDQTVLAYSASKLINEKSEFISLDPWVSGQINKKWIDSYRNSGIAEIKDHLRYVNTIPNASAVVFRRNLIEKIDIPLHMRYAGDWKIWIELLKNGEIAYLNKPLNSFRMHSHSTRFTKDFEREKIRYKEYFEIICQNSNFLSRIKNRDKFKWLILEFRNKRKIIHKEIIFQDWIPLDFRLRIKLERFSSYFNSLQYHFKSLFN